MLTLVRKVTRYFSISSQNITSYLYTVITVTTCNFVTCNKVTYKHWMVIFMCPHMSMANFCPNVLTVDSYYKLTY